MSFPFAQGTLGHNYLLYSTKQQAWAVNKTLATKFPLMYHKLMTIITLSGGTAHELPTDLKKALLAAPAAATAWESLTPLARNEFICWNISVKQAATRENHIKRTVTEIQEGKRRPCCWIGCIHRTDKEISPSVKGILAKRSK